MFFFQRCCDVFRTKKNKQTNKQTHTKTKTEQEKKTNGKRKRASSPERLQQKESYITKKEDGQSAQCKKDFNEETPTRTKKQVCLPYGAVDISCRWAPRELEADEPVFWTYSPYIDLPLDIGCFKPFRCFLKKQKDVHSYSKTLLGLCKSKKVWDPLPVSKLLLQYLSPYVMTWEELAVSLDRVYGTPVTTEAYNESGDYKSYMDGEFYPGISTPACMYPTTALSGISMASASEITYHTND